MYTATKLGDTIDRQKQRRIVTVRFIDGESSFEKDFEFNITATVEEMKRRVKSYLDEINFVPPAVADGALDLTVADEPEPMKTAAELAREQWDKDRSRLATLMELVRDGVYSGTEKPITDLQTKVRAGFKAEYLG